MILIIIFLLVLSVYFFTQETTKECYGTYQGTGIWSAYTFSCSKGTCTYTQNGVGGGLPVYAYSINSNQLIINPPSPMPAQFFYVVLNCTGRPQCARSSTAPLLSFYSLPPNGIGPELVSDGGTRIYNITEGLC